MRRGASWGGSAPGYGRGDLVSSSRRCSKCSSVVVAALIAIGILGDGATAFDVLLRAPNYVFVGDSALLRCEHGVDSELLHKVEWLKDGDHKLFQFVRGRNPPYRNFTTPGATLDWGRSNEREIHLTGLGLEASGIYSCEVSMETPIYTKPSNDERLVVIQRQAEDPVLMGASPSYYAGDRVAVNCTTSPAHPPVHITWLVNGRQVSDQLLTWFSEGSIHQYEFMPHGGHHNRPFRTHSGEEYLGSEGDRRRSEEVARAREEKTSQVSTELKQPGNKVLVRGTELADPTATAAATNGSVGDLDEGSGSAVGIQLPGRVGLEVAVDPTPGDPNDAYPPEIVPVVTASASSSTVQLSFQLTDEVVRYLKQDAEGVDTPQDLGGGRRKVRLILTCLAIIPEFVDSYDQYADRRLTSLAADVLISEETTARYSSASCTKPWVLFPLVTAVILFVPQVLSSWPLSPTFLSSPGHRSVLPSIFLNLNHARPRR